jgi:uncharacterized protein (DUF302 family)
MSTDLGLNITLNVSYEQAIEQVTAALKEQGFGVLTEIDVKATLKKKLDIDFRRYVILGACNPNLAHRALNAELDVGLLLPCNVIVYENNEAQTTVSLVDPISMLGVVDNTDLQSVADEARSRLEKVIDKLGN